MTPTVEYAFSDDWLVKFKLRHGMRKLDVSVELRSSDFETANEVCNMFISLIYLYWNNLTPDQIHNADKNG